MCQITKKIIALPKVLLDLKSMEEMPTPRDHIDQTDFLYFMPDSFYDSLENFLFKYGAPPDR